MHVLIPRFSYSYINIIILRDICYMYSYIVAIIVVPQLARNNYNVYPKQLEYSSEISDQINCCLKAKPIGVESCMARVC